MIDFTKIYCNLHPHQLVTNFCCKDQCLIGLCANCVCTHTQIHIEKGTAPDYENIRTTYRKVQQNIRSQVEVFEKDKERIDKVNSTVLQKRQKVKEIMELAKQQVSVLLGNYFEEKQKNMLRQIEAQQKKYGLHCQSRLESLNSYISREVSSLVAAAQQLSSTNFLQSLPRIRSQYLVNSAKLHSQIEIEIEQNEKFSTTISCNRGLLSSLIQVLEKAITVNFDGNIDPHSLRTYYQQQNMRPKSHGKIQENSFYNQCHQPTPNLKQRNSQSQLSYMPNINPYQNNITTFRNINNNNNQPRKNSFLSEIPNSIFDAKQTEMKQHKISANGLNIKQNSQPLGVRYSPPNANIRFSNAGLNIPINHPNQSFAQSSYPQKMQIPAMNQSRTNDRSSFRSFEKPANFSIVQTTNPGNLLDTIKSGRGQLQKVSGAGLSKKSKRSGLKLLTSAEEEILSRIQNTAENDKSYRDY